jgi:YfiH family protein
MHPTNAEQAPQHTLSHDDAVKPPVIQAQLLSAEGFGHAFFTRIGGISASPWDTLNIAASTGDDPAAVRENIRRCAVALGVPMERLYFLSQVHGTDAQVLDGTEDRDEIVKKVGDITASRVSGVACGVRSADCTPVLLADRLSGAVVAVHSGWRGTVANAAAAGVRALYALAPGASIIAAIGPHIERCCFEVGDDVASSLASASSLGEASIDRSRGRPHVDLRRIVRAQLESAGVEPSRIEDVDGCTVCDAERFFSYRRDGERSGRLLSAIVAR